MAKDTKAKRIIFKSRNEAKDFLMNSFTSFKELPTIQQRKTFLLELQASPEFRVAIAMVTPLRKLAIPKRTLTVKTVDLTEEYGPFQSSMSRDSCVDYVYTKKYYDVNHRTGHE